MISEYHYENPNYTKVDGKMKWPDIESEMATLDLLISGKSISRFGDGEFELIKGNSIAFQKRHSTLGKRLGEILCSSSDCLIGIPNLNQISKEKFSYWENRVESYTSLLDDGKIYHSSFVSRPDHIPEIDNENFFRKFTEIWKDRRVIFIIGDGEHDDTPFIGSQSLFSASSSHEIWKLPSKHAFSGYGNILSRCLSEPEGTIFSISLGPTATVLSFDLDKCGFQALDVGSFPRFYNWRLGSN